MPPGRCRVKLLHPNAQLPVRAHPTDCGADLFAVEPATLSPLRMTMVRTGIALQCPAGYAAEVRPRSGLTSRGVLVELGTIDAGYTGEILVAMWSLSTYEIKAGDRIAQIVVAMSQSWLQFELADELEERERGERGIGSTGR